MEQITNYVKPELIVVAIALYFVGMALKQAQAVKDKYIPLILGGISIAICAIYVFATCTCGTGQDIAMAIFTSIPLISMSVSFHRAKRDGFSSLIRLYLPVLQQASYDIFLH